MHTRLQALSHIFKEDIPTVFHIFSRDLKTLIHHPVALIIVLGIAFIPSLYAWVNIYANWDPYGNTGNLQVAVVNNDAGYHAEGLSLDLGESIIENLHTNDAIGWKFVDEQEGREGVRAGRYYAAVILPQTFSEDVVTFITDQDEQPAIEYFSNEKKNAIATKITNTGINTLQSTINEQFVSTLSSVLLDVVNLAEYTLENNGDALLNHMTGSLKEADKNLDAFSVSVNLLIETARSAQSLVDAGRALIPDADTTVQDSITVIESLRLLTQSSSDAANALTDTMDRNMQSIGNTVSDLCDDLEKALSDGEAVTAEAADALDRAAATADSAADTVHDFRSFLTDHKTDFLTMARRLDHVIDTIRGSNIPVPLRDNSDSSNLAGRLSTAIDEVSSLLKQVEQDLNTISSSAHHAAAVIRENNSLPTDTLASLRSSLKNLRNDLEAVGSKYNETLSPLLDDTVQQFYTCLNSLSGLLLSTGQTFPLMDRTMLHVNDSLEHAIAALSGTQAMISSAQGTIRSVLDTLSSTEENARLAKLLEIIRDDPGSVADFLSSPVSLDSTQVYPVENYGSAMTPFYTILAIWVGGLVMCSLLKTRVKEDEKLHHLGPTVTYFGRYCLFALIAIAQALIVCLGDLYILKIQCLHPVHFIFAGVVASLVFSLLLYTLTVSFGDVGMAIAVIFLVVQVAGSGGTFPPELLPPIFRAVNPYLPFTFGIDAMREAIAGLYGNNFSSYLWGLSCIYIPLSLFIGIVLRRPVIWLNNFFEHQVEKTGLL